MLTKFVIIVAWVGATIFTYVWLMRVGKLRDQGRGWFDSLIKENDLVLFGAVGIMTLFTMALR